MKHYMLSVCYPADATRPPQDVLERVMRDANAVRNEMKAAGAWVFSAGLFPPTTATVVRPEDGELILTDGPFIESKEQIGGFSIVTVADLDAALEWGGKLARAIGVPIEVRPLQEHGAAEPGRLDHHNGAKSRNRSIPPRKFSRGSVRRGGRAGELLRRRVRG